MSRTERLLTTGHGFRTDTAGDDWSLLLDLHPNLLVIGSTAATEAFIQALVPHVRSPVQSLMGGALPPELPSDGTLILRDVDILEGDQQERLLRWLGEPRSGHPQVVSLTTAALYSRVQAGMFSDRLYYRLNVVHFRLVC